MNLLDELAAARPSGLDPAPDPDRRYRHLDAALSQRPEGARRHRRSGGARTRRRAALGLGVVAVGAAAAVAVATTGGSATRPRTTAGHSTAPGSTFLLAAAKAELLPTGKYWFSDQVEGQSYIVRPGNYAVSATGSEFFHWTGAKKGDGEYFAGRDLAFRPWSAADMAAWKAAGKPSTLRVWAGDHYDTIVAKTSPWDSNKPTPNGGGQFVLPGKQKATVEDIQRLPTDPAALSKIVFAQRDPARGGGKGKNPPPELAAWIKKRDANPGFRLALASGFLEGSPLPPKVQAAVMRLLKSQPGVREIDNVTDPLGRRGVALAGAELRQGIDYVNGKWTITDNGYGHEEQLIFDPKTGAYLGERDVLTSPGRQWASRAPGFTIFYWAVRASGWTNTKPALPTSLPF